MGNILRKLCSSAKSYGKQELAHHGVTLDTVGCAALAHDLSQFEVNEEVPEGLSEYVDASSTTQATWYRKLLVAWKAAQPRPKNAQEAAQFVVQTLHGHHKANVEGLLSFYGLSPSLATTAADPAPAVLVPTPVALYPQVAIATGPWPKGVQYELHTLPVDSKGAIDGDTLVVYVDTSSDKREAASVPLPVQEAVAKRRTARMKRDYKTADSLQKEILKAGYKVVDSKDGTGETLTHKYRVRLRGVDAPEKSMPYGQEAKAMLESLVEGQPLQLLVYTIDMYGRIVADIHCSKGFIQEILLKNGCTWHYVAYEKREEFAKWEAEARAARKGLWAVKNPEKPWEYRKDRRNR